MASRRYIVVVCCDLPTQRMCSDAPIYAGPKPYPYQRLNHRRPRASWATWCERHGGGLAWHVCWRVGRPVAREIRSGFVLQARRDSTDESRLRCKERHRLEVVGGVTANFL